MVKFEINNTRNWIVINNHIKEGKSISMDQSIKLRKYTDNFVLFSDTQFDLVFCFPIYNNTVLKNVKDDEKGVLTIGWQGEQAELKFTLRNEHDIHILSYGIIERDNPENIKNIKDWLSKQLI